MTAGKGVYRVCPRCERATNGWLLARGDACSVDHAVYCIREPRPEWPVAEVQPVEYEWAQLPTGAVFHLVTAGSDRARCGRRIAEDRRTTQIVGSGCRDCNAAAGRVAA